jgi:hypothetical protein
MRGMSVARIRLVTLVGAMLIIGPGKRDRPKPDPVVGAMTRRKQDGFGRWNLDHTLKRTSPCRCVSQQRHPERVAAADRVNAQFGLRHPKLAGQRDAIGVRGVELQPAAQRNPHRGRLTAHAQHTAASAAEHCDQAVALAVGRER